MIDFLKMKLKQKKLTLKNLLKKATSDKKEDAVFEEKSMIKIGGKDIIKEKIKLSLLQSLDEAESQISKEDYQKYNKIMDYLYNYPDIEEEVLFKELESDFNETAEELQQFVHDNMQDAIEYYSGKSINSISLKTTDIRSSIEKFFNENVKDEKSLKINTDEADVNITNLRSISKGELSYDNHSYDYIIKTEHKVDFQEAEIFQLKINGINIDFE